MALCSLWTERRTGVLRTRGALDRERRAEYALVVVAEDAGRPPLRATALLRLAVADLDDHKPHFARNLVSSIRLHLIIRLIVLRWRTVRKPFLKALPMEQPVRNMEGTEVTPSPFKIPSDR